MDASQMKAIQWPKAKIGGAEYSLRLDYSAHAQLFAWGFGGVTHIPAAAWAAAMAGTFDPRSGKWRSAGFMRWVDVADTLLPEEADPLMAAVDEAIKKASPGATVTVEIEPAKENEIHPVQ
jgi:hypothetical protein